MIMRVFNILPPAACYLLSAVAVASTYYIYEGVFVERQAMKVALATQAPEAIRIDEFRGETTPIGEVSFIAQLRTDWTHAFVVREDNISVEKTISYLVAPGASELGTEALAAIYIPAEKTESLDAWLAASAIETSPLGQLYQLNGRVVDGDEKTRATVHLLESGLRASEDFVVIEPFLEGRTAALTPPPMDYSGYIVGGLIALLLAFLGYQRSIEDRSSRQPRVTSTEVMSKLSPMATGTADPDLDLVPPRTISKADPNSPLGRIQARAQSESLES
ncbi:MAG: hypothetical protein HKN27_05580 [Silicimonas sp.]|nr:hypothetical protein [Silicimonas sp.]